MENCQKGKLLKFSSAKAICEPIFYLMFIMSTFNIYFHNFVSQFITSVVVAFSLSPNINFTSRVFTPAAWYFLMHLLSLTSISPKIGLVENVCIRIEYKVIKLNNNLKQHLFLIITHTLGFFKKDEVFHSKNYCYATTAKPKGRVIFCISVCSVVASIFLNRF